MLQCCYKSCNNQVFKGCVHYIFATLFLSLKESTCETRKNAFLFHFKISFRSPENQILEF